MPLARRSVEQASGLYCSRKTRVGFQAARPGREFICCSQGTRRTGELPRSGEAGPPRAACYIAARSDPYRLPLMELECLIFDYEAFRGYLQGAVERS